jgi:hypothetical protein
MHKLSHLKRLRWTVRVVLLVGIAASIAANVLHALPNPISQTISAWPPLALLLTVELVSRIPVHRRSLSAIRVSATATIATIAAWVSYWHMAATVSRFGETGSSAYLLPITVDGLIVVASVSLVELTAKIRSIEEPPAASTETVRQVVEAAASRLPVPVSPAPQENPTATVTRDRALVPATRSGPQFRGPSRKSPLTGRVLMEDTPQA